MTIKLKRIYDAADESDGIRVLTDRLWPRGVSKEEANLDKWLKELGPSNVLRKWFNHDEGKLAEFEEKYRKELESGAQLEALEEIKAIVSGASEEPVTLLFAAKDAINNHTQIIKRILEE